MTDRPEIGSPLDRLEREAYRFDFFQAVRLLETCAVELQSAEGEPSRASRPVGFDYAPDQEVVQFRSLPSQRFPGGNLHALQQSPGADGEPGRREMVVTFLGLFGPAGALPQHYTQLVLDRLRRKDASLRDFLDLFNHRLVSLFYRAWAKYRLPVAFSQQQTQAASQDDPITAALYSLVGLGTGGLRGRLRIPDATFVHYGGHFAHYPRNAIGLQSIIASYFGVPTRLDQFQGQWLHLRPSDQSRLGGRHTLASHDQLGLDVVVGERVWSVENKFRVCLGPLGYDRFCRFLPDDVELPGLCQLVRMYAGAEFDFDVQLILKHDEVPATQLARHDQPPESRLGWNCWITSQPRMHDAEDATFVCEGLPEMV